MEILFENQYVRTKEFFKTFYTYLYFKRPRAIVFHVYIVMSVLLILSYLLFSERMRSEYEFGIYLSLMPILYIVYVCRYYRVRKLSYLRDLEIDNGEPVEASISVTANGIDCIHAKSETATHVDLAKIKKIYNTKHYIYIMTGTKLIYPLKKDGFTKGTTEEFLAFLRGKGFKV